MSITVIPSKALYGSLGPEEASVLVTVQTPSSKAGSDPVPLYLSVCLDVSGSMAGEKLTALKATMRYIITSLSLSDSLSITKFHSSAKTKLPMTRASKFGFVDEASRLVDSLQAGGGTDILAGLTCGVEALLSGISAQGGSPGIHAILILTDGQDSSRGDPDKFGPLLEKVRAAGAVCSTFGFGADHDARTMQSISTLGGGMFTYIESANECGNAFAATLASLKGAFTKDFTLHLEVPPSTQEEMWEAWEPVGVDTQGGLTITKAHTSYATTTNATPAAPAAATVATVKFGTLALGEKRTVRVSLALPPLPPSTTASVLAAGRHTATHYALSARVAFTELASGAPSRFPPTAAVLHRAVGEDGEARAAACPLDIEVDGARARDEATSAMSKAVALADRRDHRGAAHMLREEVARLRGSVAARGGNRLVESLAEDMETLAESCASEGAYERSGGRAALTSAVGSHSSQRFSGVSSPTNHSAAAYCSPDQSLFMSSSPSATAAAARRGGGGGGGGGGAGGGAGGDGLGVADRRRRMYEHMGIMGGGRRVVGGDPTTLTSNLSSGPPSVVPPSAPPTTITSIIGGALATLAALAGVAAPAPAPSDAATAAALNPIPPPPPMQHPRPPRAPLPTAAAVAGGGGGGGDKMGGGEEEEGRGEADPAAPLQSHPPLPTPASPSTAFTAPPTLAIATTASAAAVPVASKPGSDKPSSPPHSPSSTTAQPSGGALFTPEPALGGGGFRAQ